MRLARPAVRVTSTATCGSGLHLYEILGAFISPGDVLGHEPMGIVEEVGASVTNIGPGNRVVIPFNIACGHCWTCDHGLQSQCETTKVREDGTGAALLGYLKWYSQVPGGQAEFLRVPHADYRPIKVSEDGPDERFLFLSENAVNGHPNAVRPDSRKSRDAPFTTCRIAWNP